MKLRSIPLAVATATLLSNTAAFAAGWFVEAGGGVADFSDGVYNLNSVLAATADPAANTVSVALSEPTWHEDDTTSVFHLAAGYTWRDWLNLRLTYQHFGRTAATSTSEVIVAADDYDGGTITLTYRDQVQVLSFAPELRWQATPKFALLVAPELNWVFSEAELETVSNSPVITYVPFIRRRADELSLGASVAAEFAVGEQLALSLRYRYLDLDPSWGREASVLSAGLQWTF